MSGISPYTVPYSSMSLASPSIDMMTRMMMSSSGNSDSVMYISPNSSRVSRTSSCSCLEVRICFSFWSSRNCSMSPPELMIESMSVRNWLSSSLGVSIDCVRSAVR